MCLLAGQRNRGADGRRVDAGRLAADGAAVQLWELRQPVCAGLRHPVDVPARGHCADEVGVSFCCVAYCLLAARRWRRHTSPVASRPSGAGRG